MTINKFAFSRYKIIDRELRKRDIKTIELKSIIENELSINVSTRQIQKDMEAMRSDGLLGYNAPIFYNKKVKAYGYTDRDFTIQALRLREEEINALKFYAASLSQYREHSIFSHFSNAIEKVADAVRIQTNIGTFDISAVIQSDNLPAKGIDFMSPIISCIEQGIILEFNYRKYGEAVATKRQVEPLFLKEFKNRWYLIGQSILKKGKELRTFSLDRIESISITQKRFKKSTDFDPAQYYKHSFGITRFGGKIEKIIIQFHTGQSHYLKSLPLHRTQKIVKESKHFITISIEIIPSYEFFECILGYGELCRILSPANIAGEVQDRLKKALRNYKK